MHRTHLATAAVVSLASLLAACPADPPPPKPTPPAPVAASMDAGAEAAAAPPKAPRPDTVEPLPLIGLPGKDPFGYPQRTVDKIWLRQLLLERKLDELTARIEEMQASFEVDVKKEQIVIDALQAFAVDDPGLSSRFEEWLGAHPTSFAPHAARGTWRAFAAYKRRGDKPVAQVGPATLKAVAKELEAADADLARALELQPQAAAVARERILVERAGASSARLRPLVDEATKQCPACFFVREAYLHARTPRWGGSYEEMDRYAGEAAALASKNPRLAALVGVGAADRCDAARAAKKLPQALTECEAAVTAGAHAPFLHQRALTHWVMGKKDLAVADLDRALAQRPQGFDLLIDRATLLAGTERLLDARGDVDTARAIRPGDPAVRRADIVVSTAEAIAEYRQRRFREAIALYDRIIALDPNNLEAREARFEAAKAAGLVEEEVVDAGVADSGPAGAKAGGPVDGGR